MLLLSKIEFPETQNLTVLINLCSDIEESFHKFDDADVLTDYAIDIRYNLGHIEDFLIRPLIVLHPTRGGLESRNI